MGYLLGWMLDGETSSSGTPTPPTPIPVPVEPGEPEFRDHVEVAFSRLCQQFRAKSTQ